MRVYNRFRLREIAPKFANLASVMAIRYGLVSVIPVLLVGAFSLMIKSFPIAVYQEFITEFGEGILCDLLDGVYNVTFGMLSVYMCISVSQHYAIIKKSSVGNAKIGCQIAAVGTFIILTGVTSLTTDTLGPKGMFIAILASLGASSLFCYLLSKVKTNNLLADGADANLNNALSMIFPLTITILTFTVINEMIMLLSGGLRIREVFLNFMNYLFSFTGDGFLSGILFVLLTGVMWFLGIHGSDVLEDVSATIFAPKVEINMALEAVGNAPTEILTKQFFDIFVLMGGCGSTMCLLLALLLFSKRRTNRSLAKMAAFPMLFNINEIMVFGLPIIYNPTMLVPFLCVPITCFLTSYGAMALGLVPMVTSSVEWTIPVVLGGYMATGSIAGSILQAFNLVLGIVIYRPFVKRYDEARQESAEQDYKSLLELFRKSEQSREPVNLIELPGTIGVFAKALAGEIAHAIATETIETKYQPQFDAEGKCFGAEELLRFKEETLGYIYPPLVIELAAEMGKLQELEQLIFRKTVDEALAIWRETNNSLKISVNISGVSMQSKAFEQFLIELARTKLKNHALCIELTEQTVVHFNEELKERIARLKEVGYVFAIDDFSAGNTSLQYLQENYFELVKLDGSIVQNCLDNTRTQEIISTIVGLSHNLGFQVLAEFVKSEEIRDCMARLGCTMYQGWYYSAAVDVETLKEML